MALEFWYRATISKSVSITGRGLHSGAETQLKLIPASVNTGIQFRRTDSGCVTKAHFSNVTKTQLQTSIGQDNSEINTIEHLMAACSAWGIDDLIVEIDGPEVPIMDGSSSAFVFLLERAGRKEFTSHPRKYLRLKKEVILQQGKSYIEASPTVKNQLTIVGSIDFKHPKVKHQKFHYSHSQKNFLNELCSARTFCFLRDVEAMRSKGLIKGGCLQSAIVFDEQSVLNPEGLRFPDELVRHKILDSIGDFYGAGFPIIGHFRIHCGGHEINLQAIKAIFEDPQAFEIITHEDLGLQIPEMLTA